MIIGLTGSYGAGKGEVADYLVKNGFEYFSLSDEIREVLMGRGMNPTRDNLISAGNELRAKFGAGYWAERVARKIKKSCVVDSIRNPLEVEVLRRKDSFVLVAITAPAELRFERSKERGGVADDVTMQEFVENEKREMSSDPAKQQLHIVMEMADYKIVNDGTLEELHAKVDKVLEEL